METPDAPIWAARHDRAQGVRWLPLRGDGGALQAGLAGWPSCRRAPERLGDVAAGAGEVLSKQYAAELLEAGGQASVTL